MMKKRGFTLIELMIVILIVAVLAAVLIPLMAGRMDRAKWSEANAACGMINSAVRAYCAEKSNLTPAELAAATGALVGGQLAFGDILGISVADLTGQYFGSAAYNVDSIDSVGATCVITVTRVGPNPPATPAAGMQYNGGAGTWLEL
jgi:prepilin-type N-terminal cleavage/methylation domain-containing protein